MKLPLIAALVALSLTVPPALAMDMGSITPTLTFPDPTPEPVTKDTGGMDQ